MSEKNIVIVGGGYAGLNAAKAVSAMLRKERRDDIGVVLVDKEAYHLRKVLLFKAAVTENHGLRVPYGLLLGDAVNVVQGELLGINAEKGTINVKSDGAGEREIGYDRLIVALGSVLREQPDGAGGIPLSSLANAAALRQLLENNVRLAAATRSADEKARLLTVAVAGAGISGIETSAEIAHWLRERASAVGLPANMARVFLVNARPRLLEQIPARQAGRIERILAQAGVTVHHSAKVIRFNGQAAVLDSAVPVRAVPDSAVPDRAVPDRAVPDSPAQLPAGACAWSLGLRPNPLSASLGLPVCADGRIIVDDQYRVAEHPGIYALGDNARIIDPSTGAEDAMTCKEASAQAARLAKIIQAELHGKPGQRHKAFMPFYCFGLGPDRGAVWTRIAGIDLMLTNKLGLAARRFTWDIASLLDKEKKAALARREFESSPVSGS